MFDDICDGLSSLDSPTHGIASVARPLPFHNVVSKSQGGLSEMPRTRDLSEVLAEKRSPSDLAEALRFSWDWTRTERLEADYSIPQTDPRLSEVRL